MILPTAPAPLSDAFAAALGRAVASFGFLEAALKRGIHARSLDDLGAQPSEAAIDAWVTRMAQVAGDSMGTLIDGFVAGLDHADGGDEQRRRALGAELRAVRDLRNMLCHASWTPTADGGFRPGFVSSRGKAAPERMEEADLDAICRRAEAVAAVVLTLARATGSDGWTADGRGDEAAAERARARARTARMAAERAGSGRALHGAVRGAARAGETEAPRRDDDAEADGAGRRRSSRLRRRRS